MGKRGASGRVVWACLRLRGKQERGRMEVGPTFRRMAGGNSSYWQSGAIGMVTVILLFCRRRRQAGVVDAVVVGVGGDVGLVTALHGFESGSRLSPRSVELEDQAKEWLEGRRAVTVEVVGEVGECKNEEGSQEGMEGLIWLSAMGGPRRPREGGGRADTAATDISFSSMRLCAWHGRTSVRVGRWDVRWVGLAEGTVPVCDGHGRPTLRRQD